MKKYKFRLQTVLDIKEKKLEQKLLELARIADVLNKEVEIEKQLVNEQNTLQSKIVAISTIDSPQSLLEIQNARHYWSTLGTKIANQKERIKNVKVFLQAKQTEVNEAVKEKKVLENLKEKEQEKFYKEFLAYERRELDEMATGRFIRQTAQG